MHYWEFLYKEMYGSNMRNYMFNYMVIICFLLFMLCNIPSPGGAWGDL